jgi:hypothetical protein
MSEVETLKSCPFCGGEAREFMWKDHIGCSNDKCGAYMANLSIAVWNTRANTRDRWVAIRGEDDLPKESGVYVWQRKDGEMGVGHFHPKLPKSEIVETCIAWHPHLPAPYTPQEVCDGTE